MIDKNGEEAGEVMVYAIEPLEDGKAKISIQDTYKIDSSSKSLFTATFGHWESVKGLAIQERNIWNRRSDLQGYKLRYESIC